MISLGIMDPIPRLSLFCDTKTTRQIVKQHVTMTTTASPSAAAATTNHSPPPTSIKSSFICGISLPSNELLRDAAQSLYLARKDGYDYAITSLPDVTTATHHPTASSSSTTTNDSGGVRGVVEKQQQQQVRTDITRLESKWWCTSIVGMIVDPPSTIMRRSSSAVKLQLPQRHGLGLLETLTMTTDTTGGKKKKEEASIIFTGMLNWASHMNIPAVILPSIPLVENKAVNDDDDTIINDNNEEAVDMFADGEEKEGYNNNNNNNANENNDANNQSACEYSRFVAAISTSSICTTSHVKLWIRVPFALADMAAYQLLLTRCDYNSSVGCILHIHRKLDTIGDDDDMTQQLIATLHTFLGSGHVKAVSWDTCIFLRNKKGYPTLSRAHQYIFAMIYGRLGRTIRTLVEGGNHDTNNGVNGGGGGATSRLHHLEYMHHLRSRSSLLSKLDTEESIIETPYLDNLQSPLQPLGDHLEYSTYETFERDPIKYVRYGEAIALALEDGMDDGRYVHVGSTTRRSVDDDDEGDGMVVDVDIYRVTILVVGAGRGPLVREAIDAVARVSKTFDNDDHVGGSQRRRRAIYANIIAIEKNPSAIHYLRGLKNVEPTWNGGQDCSDASSSTLCGNIEETMNDGVMLSNGGSIIPGTSNVTVIGCDMREASSNVQLRSMMQNEAHKADIVVSELLGSFGDNELSPECLDGVQQSGILKTTCVSIPQNYTSYIAPVSSARLHTETTTQSCLPLHPNHGPTSSPVGIQRAMETPYVVRTHAASQTHKEQPCWIFSHPHPSTAKTLSDTLLGSGEDATCNSSSANAAHNINNDRYAHISFPRDPTHGITHGCGYGAIDNDLPSFLSSTPSTLISNSNMQSDSTIVIHGFLGSFHSVLYEGKNKNRSSVISIAPNSFSVGMFSWFPLVSIDLYFVCEFIF